MRDYGLESEKEYDVHCSSKKDGCEWRGKLGEYRQHLNQNPSPENQLTGCQFVEVDCEHECGERFQRRHITSHQNKQCRKQPYSCEYCRDCDSTFEDITEIHYPKCKKYPVVCPNGCRDDLLEQQELERHLKEECPLTEVNCPLHYAGCEVKLIHKDMSGHMSDAATHLTLLATVTQNLLKENQELRHNLEYLQKSTEEDFSILNKEVFSLQLTLEGLPLDFHVKFEMEKYRINLPAFYTHPNGYKMHIYLYPNGMDLEKEVMCQSPHT